MTMPPANRDREQAKFVETSNNETAVRVLPVDGGLVAGRDYDNIGVTYPNNETEVYTYSLSAVNIATITVTYVDDTKCEILNIAYA